MVDLDTEQRVRDASFMAIGQMQRRHGDVLPVEVIRSGVVVDGEHVALFSLQKGIHKPRQLDAALAVTTAPPTSAKQASYMDAPPLLHHFHERGGGANVDLVLERVDGPVAPSSALRVTGRVS